MVAFGIISLLPVELILQAGTGTGFAMVYALLFLGHHLEPGTPGGSGLRPRRHLADWLDYRRGRGECLDHGRTGTSGVDWDRR